MMIHRMLIVPVSDLPIQSRLADRHFRLMESDIVKLGVQISRLVDLRSCLAINHMKFRDLVADFQHTREGL